jgi:tRNA-2-methylthio-N6-dimethylallyladenosine synthase
MKHFFIETYGCQMNKSDSISVVENLKKNDYVLTDSPEKADFVIINTCSVRKTAENRVWGRLGFYKNLKQKNNTTIVVMGCMSQRLGDELLSESSVDIVIGTFHKDRIPEIITNYNKGQKISFVGDKELLFGKSYSDESNPKKAFVTISHGCNNYCSYCIVPYLRGKEISRPSEDIINDIQRLADLGVLQVTLLGQNVNSYGNDSNDVKFPDLLRMIANNTGIKWIKYLSSHPKDFSDELIEVICNEKKVSKWLHLAVQSGSNKILEKMNRKYSIESYVAKIDKLKKLVPGIHLTTDILVGFSDESEKDFQDTVDLVRYVEFDDAYMYKYNIRETTFAAENLDDNISQDIKLERLDTIIKIQKEISQKNKLKRVGGIYEVLSDHWSKKSSKEILGITSEELMIIFEGNDADFEDILKIKCTKLKGNTLFGEKL